MQPVLLVTGASGFIGRTLLGHIASSIPLRFRVVLLSSRGGGACETVSDMRDGRGLYRFTPDHFHQAGIDKIDAVIHLGAFTPKSGAEANDVGGSVANILNTRHLLENLPSSPQRLVFASSLDVYAPNLRPLREEDCCEPHSLYGQSKLFCERMLEGVTAPETILQILRIGHTYGAGEEAYRKFIPETIRRLVAGEPPYLSTTGEEKRAFIHVDDCCRMILAALELEEPAGPVNIVSSEPRGLLEIASLLCRISQGFGTPPLTPFIAPGAKPGQDFVPDGAKMQRLLGRETVSLQEGLHREFEYMARRAL